MHTGICPPPPCAGTIPVALVTCVVVYLMQTAFGSGDFFVAEGHVRCVNTARSSLEDKGYRLAHTQEQQVLSWILV